MIERRLKTLILVFLWGALLEDTLLVVMAWLAPDLWFRAFHATAPDGLEVAFLRRSAGQWAAFALAQAIALWQWRRDPLWLVIAAGVRFSDLFTDIAYVLSVPSLTSLGWALLLPPRCSTCWGWSSSCAATGRRGFPERCVPESGPAVALLPEVGIECKARPTRERH